MFIRHFWYNIVLIVILGNFNGAELMFKIILNLAKQLESIKKMACKIVDSLKKSLL